jgi:hypothetical protein
LALGLAALLVAGGFVTFRTIPAVAEELKAEEQALDKERRPALIAACDRGDARAAASFGTPDATYVDQDGRQHKRRVAI